MWRQARERIALVPTMGALHEGHLSLMRQAQGAADRVIVSIFVNPTQFGEGEDFDAYPRTLKDDLEKLARIGVDTAFTPTVSEVYPQGFSTRIHVAGLTDVLCGANRPGHFDGVALVVTKLLLMSLPDIAIFGEKDYQQLMVIRRFARDLNIPVDIQGGRIVREADGLALSSRNAYLSAEEREVAAHFPKTLRELARKVAKGAPVEGAQEQAKAALLEAGFDSIDYVEVRSGKTLTLIESDAHMVDEPRVFGAVRLGKTRLIDNWQIFGA